MSFLGYKISVPVLSIILGLCLLTSQDCNAQDWVAEYDSIYSEYQILADGYKFQEAADILQRAIHLAEINANTDKLFKAFINQKESLLKLEASISVTPDLLGFEEKYFSLLSEIQRSKLKSTLAWSYYNASDFESSLTSTQKALENAIHSNDSSRYEEAYRIMAFSEYALGNFNKALSIVDKAIQYNAGDAYFLGVMQNCLYFIYLAENQKDTALSHLYNSYNIGLEHNDPYLLSNVLNLLANFFIDENEISKSILYAEEAIVHAKKISHRSRLAYLYRTLSSAYSFSNNFERSLFYSEQAYEIYGELGDTFDEMDAYVSMGVAHLYLGNHDKLALIVDKALAYYRLRSEIFHIAELYTILAESDISKNDFDSAKQNLDMAIETIGDDYFFLRSAILLRYLRLPENVFSFEMKKVIVPELLSLSSKRGMLHYLEALGDVSRMYASVDLDSALFFAHELEEIIEHRRFEFIDEKLRAVSFSEHFEFYQEVGSWHALHRKDYSSAFSYFQKSKSRLLLDELVESQKGLEAYSDSVSIIKLINLQKELDQLYLKQRSDNNSLSLDILTKETEYNLMLDQIKRANPSWSERVFPEIYSLNEVQKLIDGNSAVIEYGLVRDQLFIFFITKNDVEFIASDQVPGLKDQIGIYVNEFREGIISEKSFAELKQLSLPLNKSLLEPVFDKLIDYKSLVIIPDGSISLLPFEALVLDDEYLVTNYAIKYLPSLSIFDLINTPFQKTNMDLLAVSGSDFEIGGQWIATNPSGLASLPFSLLEVDSVSAYFEVSTVLKNETRAEQIIKSSDLTQYSYLHFATHAEIDEIFPDQSGLFLSTEIANSPIEEEDGFLNIREIRNLNLNADLVVLSACNTANGKVIDGEGLLSMNRAFLVAGASSVISGLWSIHDKSTHEFMKVFYDNLMKFEEEEISWLDRISMKLGWYNHPLIDHKTLALHQTKLEMMEHPYYNHPVHWASFVITGK